MISFKQLASGTPPDIEVTTDDHNAELAELEELFAENDFIDAATNLEAAELGEDGTATFVIPGGEAGEIGDWFEPLGSFLEECNARAIERAEQEN